MRISQLYGMVFRSLAGLVLSAFLLLACQQIFSHHLPAAKNQQEAGKYDLTVFWQNQNPAADPSAKFIRDFSDLFYPDFFRFNFLPRLVPGFSPFLEPFTGRILLRILCSCISINAP